MRPGSALDWPVSSFGFTGSRPHRITSLPAFFAVWTITRRASTMNESEAIALVSLTPSRITTRSWMPAIVPGRRSRPAVPLQPFAEAHSPGAPEPCTATACAG